MLGIACILLSLPFLGAWIYQVFVVSDENGLFSLPGISLSLPPAFWSTILFTLFLALFLEGVSRLRRGRAANLR